MADTAEEKEYDEVKLLPDYGADEEYGWGAAQQQRGDDRSEQEAARRGHIAYEGDRATPS